MIKYLFQSITRQVQFSWRSMVTGVLARAALIKSIYYRGIYLTEKSRTKISNSDIMNHISTDVGQTVTPWPHSHHFFPLRSAELTPTHSGL